MNIFAWAVKDYSGHLLKGNIKLRLWSGRRKENAEATLSKESHSMDWSRLTDESNFRLRQFEMSFKSLGGLKHGLFWRRKGIFKPRRQRRAVYRASIRWPGTTILSKRTCVMYFARDERCFTRSLAKRLCPIPARKRLWRNPPPTMAKQFRLEQDLISCLEPGRDYATDAQVSVSN